MIISIANYMFFFTACDCHLPGTLHGNTSSCNLTTGQCDCNQTLHTGGRRCNVCQENAWNRTDSSLICEGKNLPWIVERQKSFRIHILSHFPIHLPCYHSDVPERNQRQANGKLERGRFIRDSF